jgi:hypothetical protein
VANKTIIVLPSSVKKAGFHAILFLKLEPAGFLFPFGEKVASVCSAGRAFSEVFSLLPVLVDGGSVVRKIKIEATGGMGETKGNFCPNSGNQKNNHTTASTTCSSDVSQWPPFGKPAIFDKSVG